MKHLMTLMALVVAVTAGAQTSLWNPDYDEDGIIGAADLLALLTVFGVDDDGDGIWGGADLCTDTDACNFQANPSEECQYLDAIGECGGYCSEDNDGNGICDWICGIDSIDFEGHLYPTTQIGDQCWLAQSVRYLPEVTPANESNGFLPMGVVGGYLGTNVEEAMATSNYQNFGCLYNKTALEEWSLCPTGWSVPSYTSGSFQTLIENAGGNAIGGAVLKDDSLWNGTNELAFAMIPIPGGAPYVMISEPSVWGSSSPVIRFSSSDDTSIAAYNRANYYQVRCMKIQ
jgi:uncharacterized protein (TIGR02145 family)